MDGRDAALAKGTDGVGTRLSHFQFLGGGHCRHRLLMATRNSPPVSLASSSEPNPPRFRVFWNRFVVTGRALVVFSNEFCRSALIGMHYYDRARDSGAAILDHYTGVAKGWRCTLSMAFRKTHQQNPRQSAGSLFSLDERKNNDLIFIGSPSENLTLWSYQTLWNSPSTDHFGTTHRYHGDHQYASGSGEPKGSSVPA